MTQCPVEDALNEPPGAQLRLFFSDVSSMYSSRKLREWGATNYNEIHFFSSPGRAPRRRSVRCFRAIPGPIDMIVFFVLLSVQSQHVSSDGHV